jgi:NhaA family Na+:H+ antiporter
MIIDISLVFNLAISLFVGKAIGVSVFSYLSIKLKIAELPNQTNFIDIIGVAILSGVGFTMSLFIGGLAFNHNDIFMDSAKIGIIVGSLVSGIVGYIILRRSIKRKKSQIE